MSLFKDLGKKVEEFKQASESAAADAAEYECRDCDERLFTDREACPECGGDVAPIAE